VNPAIGYASAAAGGGSTILRANTDVSLPPISSRAAAPAFIAAVTELSEGSTKRPVVAEFEAAAAASPAAFEIRAMPAVMPSLDKYACEA
jgi:hypothetical protein